MKEILTRDFRVPYRPWLLFIVLIGPETFLTYLHPGLAVRLWVSLLGLAFPLVLFMGSLRPPAAGEKPAYLLESIPPPALSVRWLGALYLASAALFRVWDLGKPDWWLGGDDSLNALEALRLLQHWRWTPFVDISQIPSTLSYFCYFVLRTTGSTLLSFQIPPAVVSLSTLAVAYPAARQYFSRSLSLVFLGLLAFNEWALLIARPLLPGITLPFWEMGVLYFLGRFLGSRDAPAREGWACPLGLALGLGPYTFFAWPVFFLAVLTVVGKTVMGNGREKAGAAGWFALFLALGLAPFVYALHGENYGGYLRDAAALDGFNLLLRIRVAADYVSAVFWGGAAKGTWLPAGGGFLNALLGACFFVGAVELFRFRRDPVPRFLAGAFFVSLLPGALSKDVETHRILLAMPVALAVAAVGIQVLTLRLKTGFRIPALAVLLFLSGAVDVARSTQFRGPSGGEQRICAGILDSLARQEGPGLIFTDMVPDPQDFSLTYCTYPINAALDPRLSGSPVKWAALFTERQYAPYLAARFPGSRWVEFPTGKAGVSSRHVLGLFPVHRGESPVFTAWRDYCRFNRRINGAIVDIPSAENRKKVLAELLAFYPSIPDDAYLQSCFFEKLLFNYSWERTFYPEEDWTNWRNFSGVFHRAFGKSRKDAVLCEKFGRLLGAENRKAEARRMLEKALALSPGNPFLESEIRGMSP